MISACQICIIASAVHASRGQRAELGERAAGIWPIRSVRRRAAHSKKGISFITTLFSTAFQ